MDSDDSDYYAPSTAFPIDPVKENDIDLSMPPSNGMEYLQRVMLEAKRCDRVVTVKPKVSLRRNVEPVLEEVILIAKLKILLTKSMILFAFENWMRSWQSEGRCFRTMAILEMSNLILNIWHWPYRLTGTHHLVALPKILKLVNQFQIIKYTHHQEMYVCSFIRSHHVIWLCSAFRRLKQYPP